MSTVALDTPMAPLPPKQLSLECQLKDSDLVVEFKTQRGVEKDGAHRWTQLSASVYPKTKQGVRLSCVVFAIETLAGCRMMRWSFEDTVWIGSAAFDFDPKQSAKLIEFLTTLDVKIDDCRKGASS